MKAGQVDALFLPAAPEDLQSLAPLLASNGVTSKSLQFSAPDNGTIPVGQRGGAGRRLVSRRLTRSGWSKFASSYAKTYGDTPPRIASLAYDAVSLAVSLSRKSAGAALHRDDADAGQRLCRRRRLVPAAAQRHIRARPRHSRSARRRAADDRACAGSISSTRNIEAYAASSTISRSSTRRPLAVAPRSPLEAPTRPLAWRYCSRCLVELSAVDGRKPLLVDAFGKAQAHQQIFVGGVLRRSEPRPARCHGLRPRRRRARLPAICERAMRDV